MLYAKIVLGLAVQGPFDYSVPASIKNKIKIGSRVKIDFCNSIKVGYVSGLSPVSGFENTKPILDLIDEVPILNKKMLKLAKALSDYYCCNLGEAVETMLPEKLRHPYKIGVIASKSSSKPQGKNQVTILHSINLDKRWDVYIDYIKQASDRKESAVVLVADKVTLMCFKERLKSRLGVEPIVLFRKEVNELGQWLKAKSGEGNIAIGMRSAVFAPFDNLGLIIVDSEEEYAYKQDQVPHYHAVRIGLMRAKIENAHLVLGSFMPSLESFNLTRDNKGTYINLVSKEDFPEVKITDDPRIKKTGKAAILSRYLENAINTSLAVKEKILILVSRGGFANLASCQHCGLVFRCPRCSVNLAYYLKKNILSCRYCNHKITAPPICPECNSGYIKFSGLGIERIENEIARMFPMAKVKQIDERLNFDLGEADIFVATKYTAKHIECNFGLVGVLGIDSMLNLTDFRSAEHAIGFLSKVLSLTKKRVIVQSLVPHHYIFRALENKDFSIFYDTELKQRKQLGFPPYRHFCLIKLRGKKEELVGEFSAKLFEYLKLACDTKTMNVLSLSPGQPLKLRGNFYWQILLQLRRPEKISAFLKIHLKKNPHSGIIVTVDMDPV